MITSKAFWRGALERGLKTFLQTWLGVFGVSTAGASLNLEKALELPWETATVTAGVVTLLSLATSIGNARFTAGEPDPDLRMIASPNKPRGV